MNKDNPINQKPMEDIEAYVKTSMEEMRKNLKIKTDKIEVDYVCFRCINLNHYAVFMAYFCAIATPLMKDFILNGRRFSVFTLHKPIYVKSGRRNRKVEIIRITDYKEGSPHPTGWGHVSFTLPENIPLGNWIKAHPHIQFTSKLSQVDEVSIIETRTTLPASHIPIRFNTKKLEEIILEQKGL